MKKTNLLLLLTLLAGISMYSQKRVTSESISIAPLENQKLLKSFEEFQIVQVDLKQFSKDIAPLQSKRIIWNLGTSFDLEMDIFPHEIRSSDFSASINNERSSTDVKVQAVTYKGFLPNSSHQVRLTVSDSFIYGSIQTDDGVLMVDQLKYALNDLSIPSNKLIIYKTDDIIEDKLLCGTSDEGVENKINQQGVTTRSTSSGCNIVEFNADCDTEYWNDYNDNSFNRMLAEFNMIQQVYEDELDTVVSISSLNAFIGSMYSSSNPYTITNEIKSIWSTAPYSYQLRDLVHHFTGKNTGIFGLASSIGAACNETTPVCFTQDRTNMHQTMAHEIGHMLNGIHEDGTNCSTPNVRSIMCQGDNKQLTFSTASRTRITNFVNPKSCFNYNSTVISGNGEMCVNNTRSYTLTQFQPTAGTTITWSTNSRLAIQSGQGTQSVVVRGVSNGTGSLTCVLNYPGSCGSITETKTIKVGPPVIGISVNGPDSSGWITATADSGSAPWTWTLNNNTTWTSSIAQTSRYVGCNGGYLYVQSSNACGQGSGSTFISGCYGGYYSVVYPNPANTELIVSRNLESNDRSNQNLFLDKNLVLDIYNFNGIKVKSIKIHEAKQEIMVDVSDLVSGNYFLKIKGDNIAESHTIIIE